MKHTTNETNERERTTYTRTQRTHEHAHTTTTHDDNNKERKGTGATGRRCVLSCYKKKKNCKQNAFVSSKTKEERVQTLVDSMRLAFDWFFVALLRSLPPYFVLLPSPPPPPR